MCLSPRMKESNEKQKQLLKWLRQPQPQPHTPRQNRRFFHEVSSFILFVIRQRQQIEDEDEESLLYVYLRLIGRLFVCFFCVYYYHYDYLFHLRYPWTPFWASFCFALLSAVFMSVIATILCFMLLFFLY